MSLRIQRCAQCRERLFPARLCCPRCGGTEFHGDVVTHGHVEQVTALTDGQVLASVRCEGGLPLVARLLGNVARGDLVAISDDPEVPGPAAFVPAGPAPRETP